jgi:NhaP-type Na+/H+ or K+/H+ antiporter
MSEVVHHVASALPFKIALIGVLGVGAQWLAWKLQRPAIVLMSIAGLIFGPLIGWFLTMETPDKVHDALNLLWLNPEADFADVYRPMIGIAVAIILFEGGMTLKFKELRDASRAVTRMVFVAAPIAWLLGWFVAHEIVGLHKHIAVMVGGLFVVTGPTVIMPLLRQAHLKSRPANILKWEGIVNDPVGALFAVGGYEFIRFTLEGASLSFVLGKLLFAAVLGTVVGIASGAGLAWAFRKGHIPEYLKVPVVLAWVLAIYVLANNIANETGLLAVTALGMTMANTKFASMVEMRRFKENIAIILVSGVFVILTATLTPEVLKAMATNWRIWAFVLAMILVVRPIAVMLSTLWSGVTWRESLLVSLIAPRGVVAVAVAGLFAAELQHVAPYIENAADQAKFIADAKLFVPLAFALVFSTVIFAGFAIGPISKALGLASGSGNGILVVGSNPWSLGLAKALKGMDISVLVADTNWRRLRGARLEGLDTYYGEVLSENAVHGLDHSAFNHIIAATHNDAYNALVCVEFAPELGRHRVFQVSAHDKEDTEEDSIVFTSRGRTLSSRGRGFDLLTRDWWGGWRFRATNISEEYSMADFLADRGEDIDVFLVKQADGSLDFIQPGQQDKIETGTVLAFCPVRDKTEESRGEGAGPDGLAGPVAPLPQ